MKTEEYNKYLRQLQHIVYDQLLPQLVMMKTISKQASDFGVTIIEVEPLLHYVFAGLTHEIVLLIFRLFDEKNSDYNILHFIKYTKENVSVIKWKDTTAMSVASLDKQLEQIASHKTRITMLSKQRNKHYAHYDKKYFFSPEALERDYPFSVNDAAELIILLQKIIGEHSYALNHSCRVCMDRVFEMAAYRLFSMLLEAHKQSRRNHQQSSPQSGICTSHLPEIMEHPSAIPVRRMPDDRE